MLGFALATPVARADDIGKTYDVYHFFPIGAAAAYSGPLFKNFEFFKLLR